MTYVTHLNDEFKRRPQWLDPSGTLESLCLAPSGHSVGVNLGELDCVKFLTELKTLIWCCHVSVVWKNDACTVGQQA
jgi:hypothetical protein